MSARPNTPPPIRIAMLGSALSSTATPSSPTRPGPPLTRSYLNSSTSLSQSIQGSATLSTRSSDEWVTEMPVSGAASTTSSAEVVTLPVTPVILENSEVVREVRKKAEEEQSRVDMAVRAEKRKKTRRIPQMDDDDLNALIRSSQKVQAPSLAETELTLQLIQSVHIAPPSRGDQPEDDLDLNPAEGEEFSLDKLRSHLERFYSSVVFSAMRLVQEVIRIRGWEDGGERTGIALAIYTVAWYHGYIFLALFTFLSVLVLVPESRSYCFGPRRHRVDVSATSTLSIPETDELPWGPAASERQATTWAEQVESVLLSLVTPGGKKSEKGQEVMDEAEEKVNGVMVKDMKHQAKSEGGADGMDKKEMAVDVYGKPGMKILGGLIDKWERIANPREIGSSTPSFCPSSVSRALAHQGLLAVGSIFITPYMVSRAIGAGFGFVMFGKPVIDRTIDELDRRVPLWRRKIILEFNVLADVPTNPQLVLRLMRDAEHQQRPLPHPSPEKDEGEDSDEEDDDPGSDDEEDEKGGKKALKKMSGMKKRISAGTRTKVRRTWDKMGEIKEEGFALVSGRKKVNYEEKAKNTMDKLHISQDSKPASKLLDKLPGVSEDDLPDNPSRFYVSHAKHGPGHLIIYPPTLPSASSPDFTPARISLTTIRHVPTNQNIPLHPDQLDSSSDHLNPHTAALSKGEKGDLVISINDIISMKKTGLGKVASLAVSWALDVEGAGGTGLELEIVRRSTGPAPREGVKGDKGEGVLEADDVAVVGRTEKVVLTKIVRRDELFDRLLALGEQRWELM